MPWIIFIIFYSTHKLMKSRVKRGGFLSTQIIYKNKNLFYDKRALFFPCFKESTNNFQIFLNFNMRVRISMLISNKHIQGLDKNMIKPRKIHLVKKCLFLQSMLMALEFLLANATCNTNMKQSQCTVWDWEVSLDLTSFRFMQVLNWAGFTVC